MHNTLDKILQNKQKEVQRLDTVALDAYCQSMERPKSKTNCFKKALATSDLSIIGEIKRKSPSKGALAEIADPVLLLQKYIHGGISALSILTDKEFFSGSIDDLDIVAKLLEDTSIPILRKDFIIDKVQIIESIVHGADAVLLIVAALNEKTSELLEYAKQCGIDAIVEVHTEEERDYAIDIGAEIIGINNRNLNTFEVDINTCLELVSRIPQGIIKIAESGIKTLDDIRLIKNAKFDAVLIGETLVKSDNPSALIKEMREVG